jgi:hydrogenase maturation protease
MKHPRTVLIIGYGNPGRLDDGIGPAMAERFERLALPNVTVDSDYQLMVEDAVEIAEHNVVVFIDASVDPIEPFFFRRVHPGGTLHFSTHSADPGTLVQLAHELFHADTEAYLMGIRGYDFNEYAIGLSEKAIANMDEAFAYLKQAIEEDMFREYLPQTILQ